MTPPPSVTVFLGLPLAFQELLNRCVPNKYYDSAGDSLTHYLAKCDENDRVHHFPEMFKI